MIKMKALSLIPAILLCASGLHAQSYVHKPNNPDILQNTMRAGAVRHEIVIPDVNGYKVLKADLHIHTIYSDADVTPELRVKEAWFDGLDIIAITDHIEYRRQEDKMINFLNARVLDGDKAVNSNVIRKDADKRGIVSDLNLPVRLAQSAAQNYGITVIPGAEITREPVSIGHFNALFTTDNNLIYDRDPLQALRNAKAQGAIIMHNHPGWRRTSVESPETEQKAYDEGLIGGVETMNGSEFYPKIIDRARERGLFVAANTDIHDSATETYRAQGQLRNMTLILAADNSIEAVREALENRRTLAWSFGTLAGEEQMLKDFFKACVSVREIVSDGKYTTYAVTNNSSLEFMLQGSGTPFRFRPFTSFTAKVRKGESLKWTLLNCWCGENSNPVVEM